MSPQSTHHLLEIGCLELPRPLVNQVSIDLMLHRYLGYRSIILIALGDNLRLNSFV